MRNLSKLFGAAVVAFPIFASGASAATYDLTLNGTVANGQYSSVTIGLYHYDQWVLPLAGLDASNQINVTNGDTINATINLDQLFTIPAPKISTFFGLVVTSDSFPTDYGATSGSTTFYIGTMPVAWGDNTFDTAGSAFLNGVDLGNSVTFDSVQSNFTITYPSQPVVLNGSYIMYDLVSYAVPEPSTWALMLLGFVGLGYAGHRRSKTRLSRVASA